MLETSCRSASWSSSIESLNGPDVSLFFPKEGLLIRAVVLTERIATNDFSRLGLRVSDAKSAQ
jgi:hypothetical protein